MGSPGTSWRSISDIQKYCWRISDSGRGALFLRIGDKKGYIKVTCIIELPMYEENLLRGYMHVSFDVRIFSLSSNCFHIEFSVSPSLHL